MRPEPRRTGPPPNVVLILIDTLRPDHLDLYGYSVATAPYLAGLGERGAVFDRAISSSSWTAPATASVFTGLYPTEHGIVEGFRAHRRRAREERRADRQAENREEHHEGSAEQGQEQEGEAGNEGAREDGENEGESYNEPDAEIETEIVLNALPRNVATLPEVFAAHDYETFGLATNINIDRLMGFDRGFDHFQCLVQTDAEAAVAALDGWHDEIVQAKPYFLYLHFMDVHVPYHERAPLYSPGRNHLEDVVRRYDSEIHYLDFHLRQLHESLGWDDDTILLVISDHGEEFRERGRIGHHFSLHVEVNRVLWMVHSPNHGIGPGRYDDNVSLVDVAPTLLDLAGLEIPPDRSGRSLRALLVGSDEPLRRKLAERTLFAHRRERLPAREDQHLWSAVRGEYKLIQHFPSEDRMLFHESDVGEEQNLADTHAELADELALQIAAMRAAAEIRAGELSVELTDELRAILEQLGYLERADGRAPEDVRADEGDR